jgi:CO/xanthine dehydrogenase Mo-binding subunit
VAPAIINALRRAIGPLDADAEQALFRVPLRPEVLLAALERRQATATR